MREKGRGATNHVRAVDGDANDPNSNDFDFACPALEEIGDDYGGGTLPSDRVPTDLVSRAVQECMSGHYPLALRLLESRVTLASSQAQSKMVAYLTSKINEAQSMKGIKFENVPKGR
eukprot:PhF_6_TR25750/c1_g1_i1/m.36303